MSKPWLCLDVHNICAAEEVAHARLDASTATTAGAWRPGVTGGPTYGAYNRVARWWERGLGTSRSIMEFSKYICIRFAALNRPV